MLLLRPWAHGLLLIRIDATLSSPVVVITLGAVIGVMFIVIVLIILLSTTTITILLKSKQALRVQLNLLQAKMKEPPVRGGSRGGSWGADDPPLQPENDGKLQKN